MEGPNGGAGSNEEQQARLPSPRLVLAGLVCLRVEHVDGFPMVLCVGMLLGVSKA